MDDLARRRSLRRARGWGLVVAVVVVLLGVRLARGVSLETGLLSLMPAADRDPVLEQLALASSSQAGRTMLLVVKHGDESEAVAGARSLAAALASSRAFTHVVPGLDDNLGRAMYSLYFPHRYHLLGEGTRTLLASREGAEALVARTADHLYGPESSAASRFLEEDPLLLFLAWAQGLDPAGGRLRIRDGVPVATVEREAAALVTAVMAGDPFDEATQVDVLAVVQAARASLASDHPGVSVAFTGLVRFAAAAREDIAREISIIGLGSLAGILALVLLVFRSPRTLLVGVLPGLVGLLCALAVSLWIFPAMHALMLVVGASLIGVCIDYAFHFMAAHRVPSGSWDGEFGLRAVRPGITLGALTSMMAYAALAFTPFPGLRQMALFSSVGLAGAWATVVCWFPLLLDAPSRRTSAPRLHRLAGRILDGWASPSARRWLRPVGIALALAALVGLTRTRFDDDVRRLQRAPASLLVEDAQLRELAGGVDHSRFVLVEAASVEVMLQRQEEVASRLKGLVDQGRLGAYRSLAAVLPSKQRQRSEHASIVSALRDPVSNWAAHLAELGFPEAAIGELERDVEASGDTLLTPEAWLASPASVLHRSLWLGATDRGAASLVQLESVSSLAEVRSVLADLDGVAAIDRVADVSDLFSRYRWWALVFVSGAYLAILLLLAVRYGLRGAAVVMVPPVLTAALTLGGIGAVAGPLNVMHCLALLLVLGLGVDYAIFVAEDGADRTTTYFALILSALTTMLSFGLLALSPTPAVRAIGLVTLAGTSLALLLAPLAIGAARGSRSDRQGRTTAVLPVTLVVAVLCTSCRSTGSDDPPRFATPETHAVEIARDAYYWLQDPSSLGESLVADQSVVVHHAGGTHRFQARLECDPERLVVVGLTPGGGRAFVLLMERGRITTEDHTGGRLPFDARYMLADIQLAFWPHHPDLDGLVLREERGAGEGWSRLFLRGNEPVIEVSYESPRPWDGRLVLDHLERGYTLEVTSVPAGSPHHETPRPGSADG